MWQYTKQKFIATLNIYSKYNNNVFDDLHILDDNKWL